MRKLLGLRKKKQAPVTEMPALTKSSSSVITNSSNHPTLVAKTSQKPARSLDDNNPLPELLMPKPRHAVPPTRAILETHERDKTQVDQGSPPPVLSVPRKQDPRCGPEHQGHRHDNASATEASHETSNFRKDPAFQGLSPQPAPSEDSLQVYETALESPFSSSSISLFPGCSKSLNGVVSVVSISEPTMSTTTKEAVAASRRKQPRRAALQQFPPTTLADEGPSEHYYCRLPANPTAGSAMNTLPQEQDDEEDAVLLAAAAARMMLPPPPPPAQAGHIHDPNVQALQYHVAVIKQQCELERFAYQKREREHRARERDMLKKITDAQRKLEYTLLMQQEQRDAAVAAAARATTPRPRSANDSGYWDRNEASEYSYTDDVDPYDADEERYFERCRLPLGRSTSGSRMPTRRGRSAPRIPSGPPPVRRQRSWRYVEDRDMAGGEDGDGFYIPGEYHMYPEPEELDPAHQRHYPHPHRRPLPHLDAQPEPQPQPPNRIHRGTLLRPSDYNYYHGPHPRYRVARRWE